MLLQPLEIPSEQPSFGTNVSATAGIQGDDVAIGRHVPLQAKEKGTAPNKVYGPRTLFTLSFREPEVHDSKSMLSARQH